MSRQPRRPPNDIEQPDGFLSRWSKRKEQARSDQDSQTADEESIGTSVLDVDEPSAPTPEPVKSDEDMPPLESLDEGSDISEFFSPGVSETLRKAALRKFFHLPSFNIVDGLDDYDDDFTTFEALGDIITADMRHQEELAKEREGQAAQGHEDQAEVEEDDLEPAASESVAEEEAVRAEHDKDECAGSVETQPEQTGSSVAEEDDTKEEDLET